MKKAQIAALIPARGGSKGIANKNMTIINGYPLIHWSIQPAKKCSLIDAVYVSSDSQQICEYAERNGAIPLVRPQDISTDESTPQDYLSFHSDVLSEYKYLLLLQPTSPLRVLSDIEKAIVLLQDPARLKSSCVISFGPARTSPKNLYYLSNEKMKPFISLSSDMNRQSLPRSYEMNGAIYACEFEELQSKNFIFRAMEIVPLLMPKLRSIDIDDSEDLFIAEQVFNSFGI